MGDKNETKTKASDNKQTDELKALLTKLRMKRVAKQLNKDDEIGINDLLSIDNYDLYQWIDDHTKPDTIIYYRRIQDGLVKYIKENQNENNKILLEKQEKLMKKALKHVYNKIGSSGMTQQRLKQLLENYYKKRKITYNDDSYQQFAQRTLNEIKFGFLRDTLDIKLKTDKHSYKVFVRRPK